MVRTHLRARAAQAGALLAVIVGGALVAPGVAFADTPDVRITGLAGEVASGGQLTMQYEVAADNGDPTGGSVQVSLRVSGMDCNGSGCDDLVEIAPAGQPPFTVTLAAPTVADGETRSVTVRVTASSINAVTGKTETGSAQKTVRVKGADKPKSVRQVSGKVKDTDGEPVAGAEVGLMDSAGSTFPATTDGSGSFSIDSTDAKPIATGTLKVGARKDGFEAETVQVQGRDGRTVNVSLVLKPNAVPTTSTPSPSASASASASTKPTDEPTTEPTGATTGATQAAVPAASEEDSSGSWLYIVAGALLVAAGVGAIVLVFMRRKNDPDDDGGDDDPTGLGGPGGVVPPTQARYDAATRVSAPMGAGGGSAAATVVTPRPAAASLADAPTMVHRPAPVEDEFPDPYGAPIPPQGGYAGMATGAMAAGAVVGGAAVGGAAAAGTWSDDQDYGDQGYDNQYGQAGGGQSADGWLDDQQQAPQAQQRYDEATGLYQPQDENYQAYGGYDDRSGYDQDAGQQQYGDGTYGGGQQYDAAAQGGYDAAGQGTYGGWGAPSGGLDNGNAYGPQAGGGAYGAADGVYGQQYADQGGYDQGGQQYTAGYDQAGTYGDRYDQGGYDQHGVQQHGDELPQAGLPQAGQQHQPSQPGPGRTGWDN